MDPVFQRLGDVTIQRVEKPKAPQSGGPSGPPEVSIAEKTLEKIAKPPEIEPEGEDSFYDDEEYDSEEFDPEDEDFESPPPNLNLKRNLGNKVEITAKKFKLNSQELTFDRKSDIKHKTSAVNIQNNISSATTSQITQINAEKGQNSVSVENSAKNTSNSAKTVQNIQNSAKTNQNSAFANLNDEYVENDEELAKYEKMRAELGNFSDEDYSDYEDESEYPSDEDDLPPLPDFDESPLKTSQIAEKTPKQDEDSNDTFLDKLAEVSSILNPVGEENEAGSSSTKKSPEPPADAEDYDIDIKEKLKEMGVSFESVKKGEKTAKKLVETTENEVVVTPAKKPGSGDEDTSERKGSILNMRRNIREVMDETKLDEATLAAQRLEAERLQRVQEQQKLLRELQRQAAQERMQNKVLSLLQGHPQGHQASSSRPGPSNISQSHMGGSTVLVKLPNGQTKPMTRLPKRPFDLVKVHKSGMGPMAPSMGGSSLLQMHSAHAQMPGISPERPPGANLTPSVSIAPVSKKSPVMPIKKEIGSESESDGEGVEKKKKPAPPTIDISSDDDCIVVSEPEGEDDETSDDPSNSGLHTNDAFNQPDAEGRVIINIGHPEDEPDIFLAPQISRIIKPHQIGGVRFLYDNVIESTSRFEHSEGFGCILAHSMGLGKTLQIVCFSDIFLRHTTAKTILCIMPINTLQNWLAEYNMWLPTEEGAANSPLLTHGEVRPRKFNIHVLNDSHKTLTARAKVISVWRNEGGVLLIGYEQYRLLSMKKHPKTRRKTNNLMEPPDDSKNKVMFDAVHEALVRPGPDLVICDEGHRIKNSHASISHALKQMKTKRRIVLTGYPLQNNLMEYWCMVDFARPNYLGSKTEFCNMFERPIMNGQCIDSTDGDIKLMRYRAHVLHSLLVGFVQRRSHTVLQTSLPQKEEYVLLVRMTPFQRDLYETFMNEVVRIQAVPNPLKAFAVCCKIWNHPDVLYNFLVKRAKGDIARDIDLEEVASVTSSTTTEMGGATPLKAKRGPGKPRKATGKGKNGKPAASVTPYNSQSDISHINPQNTPQNNSQNNPHNNAQNTPQNNSQSNPQNNSQSSQFFDQSLTQFPANFGSNSSNSTYPHETSSSNFTDSSYLDNMSIQNTPENSKNYMDLSLNNQPKNEFPNNFNGPFNQFNQNFEQPPQNQWGGTQQQNDFFEHSQSNSNSSWFKKESENSQDSKPKINIISDIKLPHLSPVKTKINIISDIKIEPKKEEEDSKNEELKPEIKDEKQDLQIAAPENLLKGLNLKDKDDSGIPYDWAVELLKHYLPGCIANSGKMEILFCIIKESIALGDRLLVFSQSLVTLDLIEQFLQAREIPGDTIKWAKNSSYYRLDGSTSALEREKLINEYNSNPKIHLFLVSTRAGSLGINLIGANRVVVLDASWNPCHDTQAVCRVYRYGQRKPCFVYRLVVDNCMEKKIYDRQISKQGMSDRVVDECNPDPHLTMRDVSTLCWDNKYDEGEEKDWAHVKDNYIDVVLQKVLEKHGRRLNCEPFQHESLLVDRKEKQLSSLEKRLAKKSYEREKQASLYSSGPVPRGHRPVASVRPMQQGPGRPSRWIPAEHWQRQGMTAQEMTLPLDVVIPTNQPEKSNIVLKAGQKVLVLKSPKGVYMQLESGKIVAIKTAIKVKGKAEENASGVGGMLDKLGGGPPKPPLLPPTMRVPPSSQMQQRKIVKPFTPGVAKMNIRSVRQNIPNLSSAIQNAGRRPPNTPKTRPYKIGTEIAKAVTSQNSENENLLLHSEEHHLQMQNLPPQNYPHDFQGVQGGKPPQMPQMDETLPQQDLLENIGGKTSRGRKKPVRKTGGAPRGRKKATPTSSSLEKLEETASLALNDNLAFQETLDSITNPHHSSSSYTKDDSLLEDVDTPQSTPNPPENYPNVSASVSDTSDHSDEVTYVSEQPSTSNLPTYPPQDIQPPPNPTEYQQPQPQYPQYPQQQNQYYQPYPPQQAGYVYPPAYDMNNPYPQQAPPPPPMQYNYAYPQQGYVQPPPVQMGGMYPPPTPYDYNSAPPPQPIYHGGYYAPPPVQNYPPPPQQGMYAPPVQQQQTGGYQGEYQYNAQPPAAVQPQGGAVVPPQQQNYYPNA